jgi:hypothetical protein
VTAASGVTVFVLVIVAPIVMTFVVVVLAFLVLVLVGVGRVVVKVRRPLSTVGAGIVDVIVSSISTLRFRWLLQQSWWLFL